MKAKIKKFHSPDIFDLEKYIPDEPHSFSFLLQVFVGPDDGEGSESFDIEVCTPRWLIDHIQEDEVILGRHYLIVFRYDFKNISAKINEFVENCHGETWSDIAIKLACLGKWEFADYQE